MLLNKKCYYYFKIYFAAMHGNTIYTKYQIIILPFFFFEKSLDRIEYGGDTQFERRNEI